MSGDADRVQREIAALFLGGKRKKARAKPHRCHGCGKVTRHVFCDECRKQRTSTGEGTK